MGGWVGGGVVRDQRSEVGSEEEMDLGDGADEEGEDEEADGESDGEVREGGPEHAEG